MGLSFIFYHPLSPGPSSPSSLHSTTRYAPLPAQAASGIEQAEDLRKQACPICSRTFVQKPGLARHMRIHTGERNHKCPYPGCETRCSRRDNLRQHYYRIHLPPGSKQNSNAATRAAVAKATEAHAAQAAAPFDNPLGTTVKSTLPHDPYSQRRPHPLDPPSPIENALGLDPANCPPPPRPPDSLTPPPSNNHHVPPPGYPATPRFGYESPRNGPNTAPQSPSNAYPSPYSAGPSHHPLPPTGNSSMGLISYDRVGTNGGGSAFPSPQFPGSVYPIPNEHHRHSNMYSDGGQYPNGHHSNGGGHPSYPPATSYYPLPPHQQLPQQQQQYISPPHLTPHSYTNSPANNHAHLIYQQQQGPAPAAETISPPPTPSPAQQYPTHTYWRHAPYSSHPYLMHADVLKRCQVTGNMNLRGPTAGHRVPLPSPHLHPPTNPDATAIWGATLQAVFSLEELADDIHLSSNNLQQVEAKAVPGTFTQQLEGGVEWLGFLTW